MEWSKARPLPEWMISINARSEAVGRAGLDDVSTLLQDRLPLLETEHPPIYCYTADDCTLLCDDLLEQLSASGTEVVAGFDLEWPVTYTPGKESQTALLQLCLSPKACYLFQLSAIGGLPALLKDVLQCRNLKLVGIGIEGDLWKLARDFDIDVRPVIAQQMVDLGKMANGVLLSAERWSLDSLTQHVLKKRLNKGGEVRTGDWRRCPLSDDQLQYAAIDALACWKIYQELLERRKT